MRIEAITRRKIVVELSEDDLASLDITYEALDYASLETRRVIWIILDLVRENTGCDIDPSGQLLIDAMPRPAGGCILFFTLRGGGADPFGAGHAPALRKQEQHPAAFEFANTNALLDCARAYALSLRSEDDRLFGACELFRRGNLFRLLVRPVKVLGTVREFFSEYARFCGEDTFVAEQTREHWKRVGAPEGFRFENMGGLCAAQTPLPRQHAAKEFAPGNVYTKL
ncbi:MAG: adaptor protein MecA [Oscillospiraceae bacterium]|jgi:hypothetical protein|nr:adaptor protein MecA [Oscillospiraceae bacterium]